MIKQIPLILLGAFAAGGCKPQSPSATTTTPPAFNQSAPGPAGKDSKAVEVESKIRKIVVERLNLSPERIQLPSRWQDLGADSLDFVELIMAFEEEFHVEIPDERAEAMKTVGDAVTFVTQKSRP